MTLEQGDKRDWMDKNYTQMAKKQRPMAKIIGVCVLKEENIRPVMGCPVMK